MEDWWDVDQMVEHVLKCDHSNDNYWKGDLRIDETDEPETDYQGQI